MFRWIVAFVLGTAGAGQAESPDLAAIVQDHVIAGYADLVTGTDALAEAGCGPEIVLAYHTAFDAWLRVSHLRFGPSETDDRAFSLAFWPDPRGSAPKVLRRLIADRDPIVENGAAFGDVSVAGRGFYALEFLLFDQGFADEAEGYHCALIGAITRDMAGNARAILEGWTGGYGALMAVPGNDTYRDGTEAARQLFTALSTGLEFTSGMRLGRPLGTFDRPRPKRAEARRAGRSLRHVMLSLEATRDLAARLSGGDDAIDRAFVAALARAEALEDPVFAGVADPQSRFRVEVLQQKVDEIRTLLAQRLGPQLGVSAGFNSLDGD
ncbi:MAG: imelysin family protein [Silicimonas sp.]|nr:imelysin family protein [Silicimonas sp.]